MSVEDKLNDLIRSLLQDTQRGKIRWQCVAEDVMRTVEPIPRSIEECRRRYIFLKEGLGYIRVSISEPYRTEAFWGHIIPTADARALYEAALEHQREISQMLDEIIADFEKDDGEGYESPHWLFNNIRDAFRSIKKFVGLFKKKGKRDG